MAIEEPEYTLIEENDEFELRRYEPQIIAQVTVQGSASKASNKGFRLLADYIFGNNATNEASPKASLESEKISMTAPVVLELSANEGEAERALAQKISMTAPVVLEAYSNESDALNTQDTEPTWQVHFVMPKAFTLDTLPKPNNPAVIIKTQPQSDYAVIRFSGLTGEKKVARKTELLIQWLKDKKLTVLGKPQLARYNPPWILPFFRRNEILIEYK